MLLWGGFHAGAGYAQTAGQIYKPAGSETGRAILDPAGTGNVFDQGISFNPLPQLQLEPLGDPRTGATGGHTELIRNSSDGSPTSIYYDSGNGALVFRVRLAGQSKASKGYSFLFNTDVSLFGPKADNFTRSNPGFQFEVVLETGNGVTLYNHENGTSTTLSGGEEPYLQKAIGEGGTGFFYDFYVPISEIDSFLGGSFTGESFRVVSATITSARSGISGTISDISGVDDDLYGSSTAALISLIEASPLVGVSSLSQMVNLKPAAPALYGPLLAGSGITVEGSSLDQDVRIDLYINDTNVTSTSSITANLWSVSTNLSEGDKVYAKAVRNGIESEPSTTLTVGMVTACTVAPSNFTRSGTRLTGTVPGIEGVTLSGGLPTNLVIRVYNNDGSLFSSTSNDESTGSVYATHFTAWDDGTKDFAIDRSTSSDGNIFNSIDSGYYVTTQVSGQCESDYSGGELGTIEQTAAPTITNEQILVSSSATTINGTREANAEVFLYQGSTQIGTAAAAASTSWSIDVPGGTFVEGRQVSARAQISGEQISEQSNLVFVGQIEKSAAPIINGEYYQASNVTVSGSAFEAEGTTVRVFVDGTQVGTATVDLYGNWELAGVDLSGASQITATAEAQGKTESDASDPVTVKTGQTSPPNITTSSPLGTSATQIQGNLASQSAGGTIRIYADNELIATLNSASSSWTATVDPANLYDGAVIHATYQLTNRTESGASNTITAEGVVYYIGAVSASPDPVSGGGGETVTLTFRVLGSDFSPVGSGAVTVNFSVDSGSGSLSSASATTDGNGEVTVTYTTHSGDDLSTAGVQADAMDGSDVIDSTVSSFEVKDDSFVGAPAIADSGLTPAEGATGVALDATVSAVFDQDVSIVDVSGVTVSGASEGTVSGVSATLGGDNRTLTIAHDDFGGNNEVYTVTIPAGAVQNSGSTTNDEISWSFTTEQAAAAVHAGNSGVSADPTSLTAGSSSEISVTLQDQYGDPFTGLAAGDFSIAFSGQAETSQTLEVSTDVWIRSTEPDRTYEGDAASVRHSSVSGDTRYAIIEFDLSAVDANVLKKAELLLKALNADGNIGQDAYLIDTGGGTQAAAMTWNTYLDEYEGKEIALESLGARPAGTAGSAGDEVTTSASKTDRAKVQNVIDIGGKLTLVLKPNHSSTNVDWNDDVYSGFGNGARLTLTFDGSAVTSGTISETTTSGTYTFAFSNTIAGAVTVEVTADGVTLNDTPQVTFNAGEVSGASSVLSASPEELSVGNSSLVTVYARDEYNNPVSGISNFNITAGGDATVSVPVSETGTAGIYTFSVSNTTAESVTVEAARNAISLGTVEITFTEANVSASNSTVTVSPATVAADGSEASVITVTLRDAHNNPIGGQAGSLNLTQSGSATIGSVTETGTTGVYTASATSTTAETVSVTAGIGGTTLDDQPSITYTASNPSAENTTVSASPGSLTAGSISEVTVVLRDESDNPITGLPGSDFNITLGGSATVSQALSEDDGTPGTYTFGVTNQKAETVTATVAASSADIGSVDITFNPAAASAANTAATVPDGTAGESTTVTINMKDTYGNPVAGAAGQLALFLSGPNAGISFGSVTDKGDGSYTAAYIPLAAGTDQITITLGGIGINGSSYDSQVTAGAAAKLAVRQQPANSVAGQNLQGPPEVLVTDANGNPVSGIPVTVGLQDNGSLDDGTVELNSGSNGIAAFNDLVIQTAGSYILSFNAEGLNNALTEPFNVLAGAGVSDNTSASVPDGTAGEETILSITVVDTYGNPVKGAGGQLSLSISGANEGIEFGEVTDNGDGTYSVGYTPLAAGTDRIGISLEGVTLHSSPYSSQVTAGPPSSIAIRQQPIESVAGELLQGPPSARVFDAHGNAVAGVAVIVAMQGENEFDGGILSVDSGTDGVAAFGDLVINTSGTYTLTFGADEIEEAATSEPFTVVAGAGVVAATTATVPDGTAGEETLLAITVVDAFGNPVSGAAGQLSLSISGPNEGIEFGEATDNGDGTYSVGYTPLAAGTDRIGISLGGEALAGGPFPSEVTAGAASDLSMRGQPAESVAGEPLEGPPAVLATDAHGNPVSGLAVRAALQGGGDFDDGTLSAVTDSNGVATFGDLALNTAGTYTLLFAAEVIEEAAASEPFTVIAGPGVAAVSAAVVPDGTAGEETRLTMTVVDAFGNPVSGAAALLSLSISGPNEGIEFGEVTDHGDGSYSVGYTPLAAGTDRIGILLDGEELNDSPFNSAVSPAPVDTLLLVSGNNQLQPTLSWLEDSLTVRVLDRLENPVAGETVIFSYANHPGEALDHELSGESVETDGNGLAKVGARLGSEPGTYRVSARTSEESIDPVVFELEAEASDPDPSFVDEVNTVVFSGGLSTYMYAEYDPTLDQPRGFNFEIWVLPNSLGSDGVIAGRWSEEEGQQQYRIRIVDNVVTVELVDEDGNRYEFQVEDFFRDLESETDSPLAGMDSRTGTGGAEENSRFEWTHISLVADPDEERIQIYRDGFEVKRIQLMDNVRPSTSRMEIGRGFDGEVHEIRLWDRPRSRSEIQAEKDLILTGRENNLVLYHTFDEEGDVNMGVDSSPNGNNFHFAEDIGRKLRLRNVTRVTMHQNEDFIIRLAALDESGASLRAEVLELPGNGHLYQLDENLERGKRITAAGTTVTEDLNRSLYVPDENFAGIDQIRYQIYDQHGNSATSIMEFEVLIVNRPPVISEIGILELEHNDSLRISLDERVSDNVYKPEDMRWELGAMSENQQVASNNRALDFRLDSRKRELVIKAPPLYQVENMRLMLTAYDPEGLHGSREFGVTVKVPVTKYDLKQNFANPFSTSTMIGYSVPVTADVTIRVYDTIGRLIRTVVDKSQVPAGFHQIEWTPSGLSSGIYFYRMTAAGSDGSRYVDVKPMSFLK